MNTEIDIADDDRINVVETLDMLKTNGAEARIMALDEDCYTLFIDLLTMKRAGK
jgi:hypothetical protein